jgi:hypothetical protein
LWARGCRSEDGTSNRTMTGNRLRLSMSCYSQDALRIAARSVPRPTGNASPGGRSRVSTLLSNSLAGVAAVISILRREAISSRSPHSRRRRAGVRARTPPIYRGACRHGRGSLGRAQKRNGISFRCHGCSKPVGRVMRGDCLGAIRFQRTISAEPLARILGMP